MIPINPGNLLPVFLPGYNATHRPYQRHRQIGTDQVPYGIPAPRTRLLPVQFYLSGTAQTVGSWKLISPIDDTTEVVLDETQVTVEALADNSGFWVTWYADELLTVVPDCGYWYMVFEMSGAGNVYSEVLYVNDLCGMEDAALTISGCSSGDGSVTIKFTRTVYAADGYSIALERYNAGWSTLVTGDGAPHSVVESVGTLSRQYRIVMTSPCGVVITKTYTVTWDAGDPCGTLAISAPTTVTDISGIAPGAATWRLTFTHSTDKGNVLYQNDYTQWLFLPAPVWDRPEIQRNVEKTEDGYGNETLRFSRTVTRQGFEFADCPDWLITFLAKCGDLDTIVYQDVLTGVSFTVSNVTFESKEQGPALNTGRIYFDAEIDTFADCQENFELA